jgi:ferrous iron transport protein B
MARSCCALPASPAAAADSLVVCLAGNPNVGKSSLFNQLTGASVETANYAGMTVRATARDALWEGRAVRIVDLPGTYDMGAGEAHGGDQKSACRHLLADRPDVVAVVIDATNVARNLYIVLQLIDLGFPVVVALNLMDVARRRSLEIDVETLARALEVPVVPTVGSTGQGVAELKTKLLEMARRAADRPPGGHRYSEEIEDEVTLVERRFTGPGGETTPFGLSPRAMAFALMEHIEEVSCAVEPVPGGPESNGWSLRVARERHEAARALARSVVAQTATARRDRLWRLATSPATGLPLLGAALAAVFVVLFVVGGLLSTWLTALWQAAPGPAIEAAVYGLLGHNVVASSILWGLNGGILAALAVGIPYILTFYFILALLEDSGYLNAAAFLTDRVMHRFGLHGQAVIPLVAGAGCNVPAILGTRALPTMRERVIASTLVTLTPCSARTAVIMGAVALFVGWQWALFVYAVVFLIGVATGVLLNRYLPGRPSALIMEVFPLRRPSLRMVSRKTWHRFREFVWMAAPIIVLGSMALGALYETGLIFRASPVLDPVVGWWLGLPLVAGIALIFAVLRKELALQLLVVFAVAAYGTAASDLRQFMTADQIVTFALVSAIYIPCVATIAMLARELGRRNAALISVGTVALALLVGGVVNHALTLIG